MRISELAAMCLTWSSAAKPAMMASRFAGNKLVGCLGVKNMLRYSGMLILPDCL